MTTGATDATDAGETDLEALPPGARLLHVGMMKTGTTALQSTASRRRAELLELGVLYPGSRYNHRREAQALLRRRPDAPRTRADTWDSLVSEVAAAEERRVLISNELLSSAEVDVARTVRDDLGPLTHVVLTVRSFAAVLPSLWQQYVKSGHRDELGDFLALRLEDGRPAPTDMVRHDQGATVQRWVDVFGPEHVTVVVVDKRDPRRVSDTFERLLDLPPGTLHEDALRGESLNRSLSVHEASLLLAVNRLVADVDLTRDETDRLLFKGVTKRLLDQGRPPSPEEQLGLPPWAVGPARARSRAYAEAIAASGARVVGDLDDLVGPVDDQQRSHEPSMMVPVEVAAQAVLGAISAGLGRGSDFGARPEPEVAPEPEPEPPDLEPLPSARTRLVRLLRRRG